MSYDVIASQPIVIDNVCVASILWQGRAWGGISWGVEMGVNIGWLL